MKAGYASTLPRSSARAARAAAVLLAVTVSARCGGSEPVGPAPGGGPSEPPPVALGSWNTAAALPVAATQVGVGVVGGRIYAAGGRSGLTLSARVFRYDPSGDRWEAMPNLPEALSAVGVAALGDTVLVAGGNAAPPDRAEIMRTKVYALAPSDSVWVEHSNLPAILDGMMVAIDGGVLAWLEDAMAFLPSGSRTWVEFAPPPTSVRQPFCCGFLVAEGDSVWAVGPNQPPASARLDVRTRSWQNVRVLGEESTRVGGAWAQGGRLHVLSSQANVNTFIRFTPDGSAQTLATPSADVFGNRRREAAAVTVAGRLYLIGGEDNSGTLGPDAPPLARVDYFVPPS